MSQAIVQRSSSGNPIYIKSHQGSHKQAQLGRKRGQSTDRASLPRSIVKKYESEERSFSVYELSGSLELIGGLILTGVDTHLSISRIVRNKVIDKGDLIIEDGIYKMFASDLKGHIVATLYNTQGEILGTGEFDLYKLPEQVKRSSQIDRLHIKVKPYNPGTAIASVHSGESFGKYRIPSKNSHVVMNSLQKGFERGVDGGFYEGDNLLPHSSFIVMANEKDHWGSLTVAVSGRENTMRVYPDFMVRALLDSQGMDADNRDLSIIWGRVTTDGQPFRGAKVELASRFVEPIYFNVYIPDPHLEATETDGLFAFVGVPSGLNSVRIIVDGESISTHVLLGEEGYVSYLNAEVGNYRSAGVFVYDGQTKESLHANIEVYGTEKVIAVDGSKEEAIRFADGAGIMMLEVESEDDYLPSRYSVSRLQKFIDLPMVKADWLYQMTINAEIEQVSDLGIIVGYVDGTDYHVSLGKDIPYETQNIVYFDNNKDSNGLICSSGKDGGRFYTV